MKKKLLILVTLFFSVATFAQNITKHDSLPVNNNLPITPIFSNAGPVLDTVKSSVSEDLPVYKKFPTIPAFSLIRPDSAVYTTDSIPKNKATVIIYFSPDCSHCQYEAKQIVKGQAELHNATFVWVSFHPLPEISTFKSQYGMDSLTNMVFGRDPKYFLPAFYKVAFTPYMAVYNARGQFVKEFREGAEIKELKELINN